VLILGKISRVWAPNHDPGLTGAGFVTENNETYLTKARPPAEAGGRKGVFVSVEAETPFDSIEGSHEYVALLADAVDEARRDVEGQIAAAEHDGADRRKEALLLVSYNLAKLNLHITASRRILNDLRTLRRLLLAERGLAVAEGAGVLPGDQT
jgi:hypothetical protein